MIGSSSTAASRMASAASKSTCVSRSADRRILRKRPRRRCGDELVRRVDQPKRRRRAFVKREPVHRAAVVRSDLLAEARELIRRRAGRRQPPPAIARRHRRDAADQVAEVVREVDVVALVVALPREVAVAAERDLLHEIQPQRIVTSGPRRSAASIGSTIVPSVLLIRWPFNVMNPWPKTCRGSGSSAAISIAGQITAWNRVMSLPMTCRSAGHHFSNMLRIARPGRPPTRS